MASPLTVDDIRAAAGRLVGEVTRTPCLPSRTLTELAGCDVFLKFENLQFTASFKERGALNKMAQLTADERAHGVLAVSAGNHAQAVAYHAERMGIAATIVMPRFRAVGQGRAHARLRRRGRARRRHLRGCAGARLELAKERALTVVHPYDDLAVIAGQGTIGLEMLEQQPSIDTLVIAIGGGGLIAGIATAARALRPDIQIVGVQTERFPAAWNSVHGGDRACAQATIADGIGVKAPGALTLPLIRAWSTTSCWSVEDDIEQAILMLLEIEKTVVEGAGAVGLAAVMKDRARFAGARSGWSSAAATSSRWCSPRSSSAAWSSQAGWRACASTSATCPARSPTSRCCSAGSAPTSTRSSTSAPSRRCRSSGSRSRSWCRPAASRTSRRSCRRCASRATPPNGSADAGRRRALLPARSTRLQGFARGASLQ
jgi:threonine dehydratase